MAKKVARLFEQFQPSNYQLHLTPDRDAMTFCGAVTVRGKKTGRPSQRLTFHQKGLSITKATLTKHDKKGDVPVVVSRINNQNSLDEVRLHAETMLYPGEYTVTMEFEGQITKPMHGIYPCFFTHDGKEKKLIATQFESHHAREGLPCIDEPEAKATFDLTLTTPKNETVLSNTPAKVERLDGDNVVTTFETTPRMSVYLLAFVYGEMEYKESKTKDGIVVRSYATPDNVKLADHSVDCAVRMLEFFSDYFNTPYPLPKFDQVALPDFAVGAMENWGLVTFREQTLLADPKTSSIESKQTIALVVAHEMSHQWFGNLVTMKWWDDLWLNESFANLMEYVAVDAQFPDWHIWEQFVSYETGSAKRRDSLADVQSIKTNVNHPDEINSIFDPSIVYAKGGSVLHMLMRYVGEAAFREGLTAYFTKHRYGNTVANDLWESLSAASGQDISAFMEDWLKRPGYPVVEVATEPGAKTLKLEQRRFLSDATATAKVSDNKPWQVPLAATHSIQPQTLTKSADVGTVKPAKGPLLLNHDGASYFVPHYSNPAHLQDIVNSLKHHEVSDIDRLLLIDNYTLLQRGGVASTTELLDLLQAYEGEESVTVWGALASSIGEIRRLIEGDDVSETRLDNLVQRLVLPLVENLGWDDKPDDSANTLRLRGTAISIATGAKTQAVINEGSRRFAAFNKPGDLSPSTRTVVYHIAARYGSNEDFDRLYKLHNTIGSADEREELAAGLTGAKATVRHDKLIKLLTSEHVKRQDLLHWFAWLIRNRYSRKAAWQWLTENWGWIENEMSSDKTYSYFARYAGSVFSHSAELKQFMSFFGPKSDAIALQREILLAEAEIKGRIAWRDRNEAAVKTWLKKL